MPNPRSWQEMRSRTMAQLLRETGADLEAWKARIGAEPGLGTEDDLRRWLDEQGVNGYPRMLLVQETFGYPDYLLASADELIDAQYRDRPALRPIYDRLIAALPEIGDVEVQARKGYVALIGPRRTFASIQPSTRTRVDVGLRLDGVEPRGRLETAKGIGQSSMTHKIALTSPEQVDGEVKAWLRKAYDSNL